LVQFPFKDISKCRATCYYGKPGSSWKSGKHDGIDLVSDGDKTILSVTDGFVIRSGINTSWGQYVVVRMADGRSIVYAHMSAGSRKVKEGDSIKAGQAIGTMGSTGNSTGPHLHIELQKKYYKSGSTDDIAAFLGIKNEVGKVQREVKEVTFEEAKQVVQKQAGLSDETMAFLLAYRYYDKLILKLAEAMQ